MKVRPFRPDDEPILRDAYLRRGFEGGWRSMDDAVAAQVVVDEQDRPVALVAAHRIAEVRAVVDQQWQTPAWREEALKLAHDACLAELHGIGYRRVTALLEGAVGRGFGRRLKRLRGWVISRGVAWERGLDE